MNTKFPKYMSILILVLLILFFAYTGYFFSPGFFKTYDKPTILFLLIMYLIFYAIHFIVEKKLDPPKLVGKDMVFLVLKFIIPLFYALIRQYLITDTKDKKNFLFHFLIYAVLFMILDTIIYYSLINKNNGQSN